MKFMMNPYLINFQPIPNNCNLPPTIYSLLESIVNYGTDEKTKIKDLAKIGRKTIFNFCYPLSKNVIKEDFETMILNHFLMRRIGFDTLTAFQIQLNVKLNEIMPLYNKMFDALENWDIFESGEITIRESIDDRTMKNNVKTNNTLENSSETSGEETSDRRNSELPQDEIDDVKNGTYLTDYNFDTNKNKSNDKSNSKGESISESNSTDNNKLNETIKRSPSDKIAIYKEFQENLKSIYTLIFKDLESLFYGLV